MGAFSLLLSMQPCPRLFTEVTYAGEWKVHCASVRGHCYSDRQKIAVVNTLAVIVAGKESCRFIFPIRVSRKCLEHFFADD